MGYLSDERIEEIIIQLGSAIQEQPDLSADDLKRVFIDLGGSETEWVWAAEEARRRLKEAQSYATAMHHEAAVEAARKAAGLDPFLIDALLVGAQSALKLWSTSQKESHRQQADIFATRALRIQPKNETAARVISAVHHRSKSNQQSASKRKQMVLVAVALGILVLGGVVAALTAGADPQNGEKATQQRESTVHHTLIDAQEDVHAARAQVVNVIRRRAELIPQVVAAVTDNDAGLSGQLETLSKDLAAAGNDLDNLHQLNTQLTHILLTVNQNLRAQDDKALETLLVQIEGATNRITVERERYNQAVRNYNTLLRKTAEPPSGFEPMNYLE